MEKLSFINWLQKKTYFGSQQNFSRCFHTLIQYASFSSEIVVEMSYNINASNFLDLVFEKIKKQSLKPHYPNFRAIIVAKSVFSSARIIKECKLAISINYKNSMLIKIIKNKHKSGV